MNLLIFMKSKPRGPIIAIVFVGLVLLTLPTASFNSQAQTSSQRESQTTTQQAKPDGRELQVGIPIEQELKGGESHSYRLKVTAGEFLKVVVEQKGIDVVVRLFGSDSKQIIEFNSPNGALGPETLSAVANSGGEYRVEVKSVESTAPTGRYEMRLEELREPTAKDLDRIRAERAFTEAGRLEAEGTAEARQKAFDRYNEALSLWTAIDDRYMAAVTLTEMGGISRALGKVQKALEYHSQALSLRRAVGDRRGEGESLQNVGVTYSQLGDSQKALDYYQQALPLMRAVGDRQAEANALASIGGTYQYQGNLPQALDYGNQALALHRALGNRQLEAVTLNNLSMAYSNLGESQKALDCLNQALSLTRGLTDRRYESAMLGNIGLVYRELGEYQKALEYYDQALPLMRASGDRDGEASTLHNIGSTYLSLGEPKKALEYFNQTLLLVRASGDRYGEAFTLQNTGMAYRALGEPQKALDFLNQALLLRRAVGDILGEAGTLDRIGTTYSSMGKHEEAARYLEQALSLARPLGARSTEAATLAHLARAEQGRGRLAVARTQIEAALNIIEGLRSKFIARQLRTSFSASTREYYDLYINLLMQMHQTEPRAGHDVTAFDASERARARSLLEMIAEARVDIRQGVDAALLERERTAQQQLNAKSERLTRLLSRKPTEEQASTAKKEVENLLKDYEDVSAEIRAKSPRYAALTQPQPLKVTEIQRLLDKDTVLLEYALGAERSYLWAVTPDTVKSFELPKGKEIESAAHQFHKLITDNANRNIPDQVQAATVLSTLVLSPVVAELGQKRLVIVSDGALQYVPFSALAVPGSLAPTANQGKVKNRLAAPQYRPLITQHEIVQLPSASVLGELRRELRTRTPSDKTVAVMADPVFQDTDPRIDRTRSAGGGVAGESKTSEEQTRSDLKRSLEESGLADLRRLPYSRREAEAIVALAPKGESLMAVDFDASRATVTDDKLAKFRIVHFATHVLLNSSHPELSGIVLSLVSQDGQPQNGFLRLNEIYNLRLSADLVVLSACQTALGKEVRGEGLIGLTRGFMYAGAPRVVVTSWEINDEATAEFMKRFYDGMFKRGMRPAEALREAQLAMWKTRWWKAPYYWAGFQLQGEFR
jgi:CHAT domain-containing protein/Tfp pilus assembly protein PilF